MFSSHLTWLSLTTFNTDETVYKERYCWWSNTTLRWKPHQEFSLICFDYYLQPEITRKRSISLTNLLNVDAAGGINWHRTTIPFCCADWNNACGLTHRTRLARAYVAALAYTIYICFWLNCVANIKLMSLYLKSTNSFCWVVIAPGYDKALTYFRRKEKNKNKLIQSEV
jgi:AICAR transformylase/IMP cyclohydrolase PurH